MKNIFRLIRKGLAHLKHAVIEEFQYRFLRKTGYGDNLLRLRKFRVFHKDLKCGNDPVVYLTLDVEWNEKPYFAQMLDTLREKQVCAYMFLLGEGMQEHTDLLQRILSEGHCVGNHTMHHPNLSQIPEEQVLQELAACEAEFCRLTGASMPRVLRPPYGRIHRPLAKLLHRRGYTVMHWSLHVPDYMQEQPAWEDYETYLHAKLHRGGIILQHSFSAATAENLGRIIDLCREKGYRFARKADYDRFLA